MNIGLVKSGVNDSGDNRRSQNKAASDAVKFSKNENIRKLTYKLASMYHSARKMIVMINAMSRRTECAVFIIEQLLSNGSYRRAKWTVQE